MKPVLLHYLACPMCRAEFRLDIHEKKPVNLSEKEKNYIRARQKDISEYESEIMQGILSCAACGVAFPISGGVPRIYKGADEDYPVSGLPQGSTSRMPTNKHEREVQTSFSREWDEHNYDDQTIWTWNLDDRVVTFGEELNIADPAEISGKLMIDAGCGSGILSMTVSERYQVEIIPIDMSFIIGRAFTRNRSNLCHYVQTSVLRPGLRQAIADITYSHGVFHHTYNTKKAFEAIAPLTKKGGVFYVWLYGKKWGWKRIEFMFHRTMRTIISRLPKYPQTFMVYVMGGLYLVIRFFRRILGMERMKIKSRSHFWTGIRDKYTPRYAREHTEAEVIGWFKENGYINVKRRTSWPKTRIFENSPNLAITGHRES